MLLGIKFGQETNGFDVECVGEYDPLCWLFTLLKKSSFPKHTASA